RAPCQPLCWRTAIRQKAVVRALSPPGGTSVRKPPMYPESLVICTEFSCRMTSARSMLHDGVTGLARRGEHTTRDSPSCPSRKAYASITALTSSRKVDDFPADRYMPTDLPAISTRISLAAAIAISSYAASLSDGC